MPTQMNVQNLKKIGDQWSEALVRTYNIDGVMLTKAAFDWLNGEHSGIRFFAAEYVEDEENGGPRMMVNVYVSESDLFMKAEDSLRRLEERIHEYQYLMDTKAMFADSIEGMLEADR